MKLDSIWKPSVLALFACIAITACTNDSDAVGSDQQGLRGGAVQGWQGDGGDGRGHFGGRGRFDDDDADGGSDERDCRDRWRRGIGDHTGHGHENEADEGGDKDGWGERP
jgi:hypothetical protein